LKGGILLHLQQQYVESNDSTNDRLPYLSTSSDAVPIVEGGRPWRLDIAVDDQVAVLSDEGLSVSGIVKEMASTNDELRIHFNLPDVSDIWVHRNDPRLQLL